MDLTQFAVGGATRPDALSGLQPEFASALANMFASAPPDIQQGLRIGSAYRSPERQAQLYQAALQKYGSPEAARKWVAPPGRSQHNHGNAADLKYMSPAATEWAHANASKYGLAFPLSNENWHVELAGARGDHNHGQGPTVQAAAAGAMQPAPMANPMAASAPAMAQGPADLPGAPSTVAAMFIQRQQQAQQAQAQQQADEEARRTALLSSITDLYG